MGTKYVSSISKRTCTTLVRLRIHLLLRWVIGQSVWRGHGGMIAPKSHGTNPHWAVIIPSSPLPLPHYPPDTKSLPQACINKVCDLLPHMRIVMIRTQIPTNQVSKYGVTQQILTIGIPCSQICSHLKEQHTHLIHNHITSTIKISQYF